MRDRQSQETEEERRLWNLPMDLLREIAIGHLTLEQAEARAEDRKRTGFTN